MRNNISSFQLFVRDDEKSRKISDNIRSLFNKTSIIESNDGDLVIAIGGDGTFIDSVTDTGFNNSKIYAGVNTGTLGFLQSISPTEFCNFIESITYKNQIHTRRLFLPKITIELEDKNKHVFYAINEVVLSGIHGQKVLFCEFINGDYYQKFFANAVCVACSTGDTALSMSNGGSIDFSNHFQLVRTITCGIINGSYERFLSNPAISSEFRFEIGEYNQIELLVDGRPKELTSPISSVAISLYGAHYINKLELGPYSKVITVRQKLLGYDD